jgi:glutathione S-transferase
MLVEESGRFDSSQWSLNSFAEFTKLSPFQTVPVLEIDGVTLVDSVAILLYLEERFPDKRPLLPKDLVQRAHIHQVVFLIASNIQPLQNTQILVCFMPQPFLVMLTP